MAVQFHAHEYLVPCWEMANKSNRSATQFAAWSCKLDAISKFDVGRVSGGERATWKAAFHVGGIAAEKKRIQNQIKLNKFIGDESFWKFKRFRRFCQW